MQLHRDQFPSGPGHSRQANDGCQRCHFILLCCHDTGSTMLYTKQYTFHSVSDKCSLNFAVTCTSWKQNQRIKIRGFVHSFVLRPGHFGSVFQQPRFPSVLMPRKSGSVRWIEVSGLEKTKKAKPATSSACMLRQFNTKTVDVLDIDT